MKKIILLLAIVFSIAGFSQPVTVTTIKTVDELVNQVLVQSNCNSALNVQSKSGNNYGSVKGIGYFEKNPNSTFPFAKGVILSTGNVTRAPGPNNTNLSDGTTAWLGDADLESVLLSQSGQTISSINASYIEFDFVPRASNFNFNFIFASEEYGASQCTNTDSFAFLIKDITPGSLTNYTNIAILDPAVYPGALPNTPISVTSVRNSLYNLSCASANPLAFGNMNPPNNNLVAINFNGQTKPLTAKASGLDISHTYHIKLVIADGNNKTGYDSAIFLEGNSFSFGSNLLGPNYEFTNGLGTCFGNTLPTLNATSQGIPVAPGTTYSWYWGEPTLSPPSNGTLITGQTGTTLNLNNLTSTLPSSAFNGPNGINYFSLVYTQPTCGATVNTIRVEVSPEIVTSPIAAKNVCRISGATSYTVDLNSQNSSILSSVQGASNPTVQFFDTLANANNVPGTSGILTLNPTIPVLATATSFQVFARITNTTTNCFTVKPITFNIIAPPVANQPSDISKCARNATDVPLQAVFTMVGTANSPASQVLGTQSSSVYGVNFYYSQADALSSTSSPISLMPNGMISVLTKGWSITPPNEGKVWVAVYNLDNPACRDIKSFNLKVLDLPFVENVVSPRVVCNQYALPALQNNGSVYRTGLSGTGATLNSGDLVPQSPPVAPNTSYIQTLYIYNIDNVTQCWNQKSFIVQILDPLNDPTWPQDALACNSYTLPTLPIWGKYYKFSGGPNTAGNTPLAGQQLTINFDPANTNTLQQIEVWVYYQGTDPLCYKEKKITITIAKYIPISSLPDLQDCTSITLPALSTLPTGSQYYNSSNLQGTATVASLGPYTGSNTTIYAYNEVVNGSVTCKSETTFNVKIGGIDNPLNIPPVTTTFCTEFILNAPTVANSGYYAGPHGSGPAPSSILLNGQPNLTLTATSPNQQITLYYYVNGQSCTNDLPATITIKKTPLPTNISNILYDQTVCDSYTLPSINTSATPAAGAVNHAGNYYLAPLGAGTGLVTSTNPNPILTVGSPPPTTIYQVYFYDGDSDPTCYLQHNFKITVNQTPDTSTVPGLIYVDAVQQPVCNTCHVAQILPTDGSKGNFYQFSHAVDPSPITNPIINPNYCSTGTYTYWYYLKGQGATNNCYSEFQTSVTVTNTTVAPVADVFSCNGYSLPAIITPSGIVPAKYYKLSGGPSVVNQVEYPVGYSSFPVGNTTIYVHAEDCDVVGHNCCSDEKSFVVHILPTPVYAPVAPTTICSGTSTSIPLTYSATVKNYDWTVSAPSITGALAGSTTNLTSISQTLLNTVSTPSLATYTITPKYTDTTQGVDCAGVPVQVLVNLNPAPVIPNQTQTICDGGTFSFTPVDATPTVATVVPSSTTYTWTALTSSPAVSGYSNQATGLSTISQTLTNTSNTPQDVVYTVTPTSGAVGNCVGNPFTITVTVNPTVTVTTAPTATICSDTATNIALTSATVGTTYTWNIGATTTVTGGSNQTTSGLTSIAQTLGNTDVNSQTINYVVQPSFTNNTVTCLGTSLTIVVTVNPKPVVVFSRADETICSNSPSSAVQLLKTTTSPNVTFAWTATQPLGVTGVVTSGAIGSINSQTIVNNNDNPVIVAYVATASTSGSLVCAGPTNTYNIIVNPTPKINNTVLSNAICTGKTPNAIVLTSATNNATYAWTATAPSQITGFTPSGTGSITSTAITNSSPTTAYDVVYTATATNADGLCPGPSFTYTLTINFRPLIDPLTYATVKTCTSYNLPVPVNGIGSYWTQDASSFGPGGQPIILPASYSAPSTTIYVYVANPADVSCYDSKPLTINVFKVDPITLDPKYCETHTLNTLTNGGYFLAQGGVNPLTNLTITQDTSFYIYGSGPSTINPSGTCFDESPKYTVVIIYRPKYFPAPAPMRTKCDTDNTNDGYFAFDLTSLNSTVLGPLQIEDTNPGGVFHVRYYASQTDAENPTPANELPSPYIATTGVPVYVSITNNSITSSQCTQINAVNIIINKLPEPKPVQYSPDPATTENVVCFAQDGTTVATTAQLNANMTTPSAYTYVWSGPAPATTVVGNTGIKTGISVPGVYNVVVTETATGCVSLPASTTIIQSQPAIASFTVSPAFTQFQSVGIIATGNAGINQHYMYSLDGGPYQDSPVFDDLDYGAHTVLVKDMNGCGITTINPFIINYPKYFTPNKDTWQSNWNIIGLDKFQDAKVYIYDRYGKIIKQITSATNGWDGTYNSELAPATDYWFAIYYTENGETKQFKSHFSLLR